MTVRAGTNSRGFFIRAVAVWFIAATTAWASAERPAAPAMPKGGAGVRVAAEWEPATGVLIAWPLKIPKNLVIELAKDVTVHVTVSDKVNEQKARAAFAEWGIAPQRLRFILTQQGDCYCWTRDWGPFAAFDAKGNYQLVDGRFRGYPRSGIDSSKGLGWMTYTPKLNVIADDAAPAAVAKALGVKRTELPVVLTGGNVVFDGQGTGLGTEILADENITMGISKDMFLRLLKPALGVDRFHFLPNFESKFGNQHADCLFKLLDEERILIKRAPPDYPDFHHIEAVVQHVAKLKNVYGRPYTILRIDTPRYNKANLANYTNSLILNRKVYVPMFGIPGDEQALQTFRDALPGYEVLGFAFAKGEGSWRFSDALHCRTRAIWDQKMLYMTHRRLDAFVPGAAAYTINVHIRDYSGAGLVENKLHLYWRTKGSSKWAEVLLNPSGPKHAFSAAIAGVPAGKTVEYYLSSVSLSGRHESLPRTAPKGFYSFTAAEKR